MYSTRWFAAFGCATALAACGGPMDQEEAGDPNVQVADGTAALVGPLTAVTLVAPGAGASVGSNPTYSWNAIVNADAYHVWVADRLSRPRVDIIVTAAAAGCPAGVGVCSTTPATTLRPGAAEYWVQARNESGSGSWGTARFFTVAAIPQPISPTGTFVGTNPTYIWSPIAGTANYHLWVNDAAGTAVNTTMTAAAASCNATTCRFTPATPLVNGSARFWVRVAGQRWSMAMSFTVASVGAPPATPTLIAPVGTGSVAATFSWNSSATTDDYTLWVNDAGGVAVNQVMTAGAAGCAAGGVCTFDPDATLDAGAVRWWVRARNSAGSSSWSAAANFTAQ